MFVETQTGQPHPGDVHGQFLITVELCGYVILILGFMAVLNYGSVSSQTMKAFIPYLLSRWMGFFPPNFTVHYFSLKIWDVPGHSSESKEGVRFLMVDPMQLGAWKNLMYWAVAMFWGNGSSRSCEIVQSHGERGSRDCLTPRKTLIPPLCRRRCTGPWSKFTVNLCSSNFSVAEIKLHDPKQRMGEFALAYSSGRIRPSWQGGTAADGAGNWDRTFDHKHKQRERRELEDEARHSQSPLTPSDILPPASSFQTITNSAIYWGPNVQMPEPTGTFLIQTPISHSLCPSFQCVCVCVISSLSFS